MSLLRSSGSFASMLVPSMMMCLMNTRGSTLSPLKIGAPARRRRAGPTHRVELDRHRQVAVLDRAQRRRHAVHAGHQRLALAVGGIHRLHRAKRDVVVGGVDRLEVGIGHQRVLGLLDAALARERAVVFGTRSGCSGYFAITSA